MSSHREAPEISKDPVADNADVYAFVSPDKPDTVTIITNFVPLQGPAGGPNFFEFGDDVLYSIYIDNDGDGRARHRVPVPVHTRRCGTRTRSSTTPGRSRRWTARTGTGASSTRSRASMRRAATERPRSRPGRPAFRGPSVLGTNLAVPALQHRPALDAELRGDLGAAGRPDARRAARRCSAGQRNDPFFVDLGSIFDLGDLRPVQSLHLIPTAGDRRASTGRRR